MTPQLMTADAEGQAAPTPPQQAVPADHVTAEQALAALDSLDDFARMSVSVDPFGPRGVLERFIAQATPPQQAPASEPYPGYRREIERAILELSEAMGSPATFGKQPQSLLSQIVRLAAHRLKQAPAPQRVGLTQAQRIRLWNNSPQLHGDVVGRDAFERLVKFIEEVHRIGITQPSQQEQANV